MHNLIIMLGAALFLPGLPLVPQLAGATLGEPATTIAADQKVLGAASISKIQNNNYTVEEIKSDATTVREYVSPAGIVFAMAWNGLVHPDLNPLLGSYAAEYNQALKKTPRKPGRRSLQVTSTRVIVEKWGHMRNLQGRAYAPGLLPPGVTIHEIK